MSQALGPFGKATVILFTAQFDSELPKLAEMKRLLKIPDGKYYRSHGHHSDLCNKIESLIHIMRNPSDEQDAWYRNRIGTDVFITVPDVHIDLFMTLKYSAQIVAGYNLTNEAVSELQQLLQNRKQVSRMRSICKSWTNTLEEHVKEAAKLGLSDPSITGIDIAAIARMTESYGDAALEQTTNALSVWHQRYRWRTAKEAFSDFTGDSDIEFSPEIVDEQIA